MSLRSDGIGVATENFWDKRKLPQMAGIDRDQIQLFWWYYNKDIVKKLAD